VMHENCADMFADMKKIADEEGYQFNPVQKDLDDIDRVSGQRNTGTAILHALAGWPAA